MESVLARLMMPIMVPLVGVQDDVLKALDDFLLDITLNYDSNKSFFDFVEVNNNNGLASCKIMDIDSNLREWLLHKQHKQLVVSLTQVDISLEERPRNAADRKIYFRVGISRVPLQMLVKYPKFCCIWLLSGENTGLANFTFVS